MWAWLPPADPYGPDGGLSSYHLPGRQGEAAEGELGIWELKAAAAAAQDSYLLAASYVALKMTLGKHTSASAHRSPLIWAANYLTKWLSGPGHLY